jgi:hypothetical protein
VLMDDDDAGGRGDDCGFFKPFCSLMVHCRGVQIPGAPGRLGMVLR